MYLELGNIIKSSKAYDLIIDHYKYDRLCDLHIWETKPLNDEQFEALEYIINTGEFIEFSYLISDDLLSDKLNNKYVIYESIEKSFDPSKKIYIIVQDDENYRDVKFYRNIAIMQEKHNATKFFR